MSTIDPGRETEAPEAGGELDVAIIGMAGRFPGADDLEAFWRNLRAGVESISFFGDDELRAAGVPDETLADPRYVKAIGRLRDVEHFDAGFFGYSPREAEVLEPGHRLFLECAWEALEDAGVDPARVEERVGVYAGAGSSGYTERHVRRSPGVMAAAGDFQVTLGSEKDFLATRVSYKLDLRGPSLGVQTGCSTALVAVHLAAQSLLRGECELALAGGASVLVPQTTGYPYQPGSIMSPDGHCRAFDARSAGAVSGSGVGAVVLKRLADALRDGDPVRAVIRGGAVNNDGAAKVAYTAPGVKGQAAVIAEALEAADVDPATVTYVEAHGTGTELGDAVEIAALTRAFRDFTARDGYCAVGSVKTNIGHLDTAAGVAGLIKAVLALEHGEIPPTVHFQAPNPKIAFAGSPFFVASRLQPWETPDGVPRRAGVSSFGIGGTNAHVVLEESPAAPPSGPSRPWQLLAVSARSDATARAAAERLADHLRAHPDLPLADVAFTLREGRHAFAHRRIAVVREGEDAAAILRGALPERVAAGVAEAGSRSVAFLFPGLGDHYPDMARGLYEAEPVFRAEVDRCAALLAPVLGMDVREALFPGEVPSDAPASGGFDFRRMLGRTGPDPAAERLNRTALAHPAVFVVDFALARLWMSWGIVPDAVIGHSLGEFVAACVAGVLSLEDALTLVAGRARLIEPLPGGAMLAVSLGPEALRPHLGEDAWIATVNAPGLCVAAGPEDAVAALERRLADAGVAARRLATTHAFHTPMLGGAAEGLAELAGSVRLRPPRIPIVSNLTGTWLTDAEATDPAYWTRHLLGTVRFAEGVGELLREKGRVLLEVGPGQTLSTFVRQRPGGGEEAPVAVVASLRHAHDRRPDQAVLLEALGRLWLAGVKPDWAAFRGGERRRKVRLPAYPWEKQRYWVDAPDPAAEPAPGASADPADWTYVPDWSRAPVPAPAADVSRVLVVAEDDWGDRLAAALERGGRAATPRRVSAAWERDDFRALVGGLAEPPQAVACVTNDPVTVLRLAEALAHAGAGTRLVAVTRDAQDVTGREPLEVGAAAVAAACLVVAQEHAPLRCRAVDVESDDAAGMDRLAAEVVADTDAAVAAWRGPHRWTRGFRAVKPSAPAAAVREGGAYLLVGGFQGQNAVFARALASVPGVRLATVAADAEGDEAARGLGAEVLALRADPADPGALTAAVREVEACLGRLDGVLWTPGDAALSFAAAAEARPAWRAELARQAAAMRALEAALGGREPDFCLVESSLAGVLGGVGLVRAALAHAQADAFAQRHARASRGRWTSVAGDRWLHPGEQAGGIPHEAVPAVLERVLALAGQPQVLVSPEDLEARLRRAARAEVRSVAAPRYARPDDLGVDYAAPSTELEERIAGVWRELLGLERIGVHDDFFALGGHSLLATQIVARLRDLFELELPLAVIFEAPTVARMAALVEDAFFAEIEVESPSRLEGLSDAKRALLEKRMRGLAHAPRRREMITRCAGEGPEHPASYMQEQMWLAVQLDPGRPVYNVPVAALVRADADVGALERAFSEVVRRHEGLRTVFRVVGGELRQVVLPPFPVRADLRDLRGRVGPDFEAGVRRKVSAEGARPLDVERGPLVRMAFLRVSDARAALVITLHHIVTDGWAYPLILHELWELYAAFRHGRALALPEPALRYADYAVWQRAHLTGETLERHVAFWRKLLEGAPETELVGDRPRPPAASYRGAFHHFLFPDSTAAALRSVCRREAATLNMALSAAFAAVLAKYTGHGDVVFGALFGNRARPELEQVVGCFVNSAALRLDLGDDPSFTGAVRRARALVLEADAHQELPFEKVVEHLRVERDPSRNPLFQVMYFHHTFIPGHSQAAAEAELDPQPVYRGEASLVDTGVAKLDLTIATLEEGDRLSAVVEYATDLFDAATVERFCRHFTTLAGRAAAEPELPLSRISLLDDEEARAVLREWPHGDPPAVEPAPFHRLFEAQAAATPGAEAIRCAGRSVRFAELDARAAELGRRLRALGVGPETVVALLLDRSPEVVAAMLGVSKAGGAFLPIDPATPPERLRFILEDAAAKAVVTERALAGGIPAGMDLVLLDADADAPGAELPARDPDADGAAYVIYTSGSTGRPKGVVVTHRGIASLARMERDVLDVGPGARVLQFASFSFDASLWDVFTLLSGATLVLAPRGDGGGETLEELLERERVNVATLPPPVLARLPADRLPALRTVVSTGEAVSAEVVRRWGAGRRFVNGYGPTETTVGATLAVDPAPAGRISIGRPFPGARVYLLDARLDPVPPGVPGEVYVGGLGIARGYLRRPGLTAERFVPDALSGVSGARLYRTGDVARWRGDGELEFVGRADRQVKLRGFRIELGEVEDALLAVSGVREAAVVVREDAPGARRLVGYAVAFPGVEADALRAALRERLPEYMVPAAFVFLDELPRTPSGKPDRRALPAPGPAAGAAAHVEPRDQAEAALARAWAQVLGRERVGVHDNFFELGGDSILAIQVIARAAGAGIKLLPWQMFRYHTIAEQAASAREAAEAAPGSAADDAFAGDGLEELDEGVLDAVLGQLELD